MGVPNNGFQYSKVAAGRDYVAIGWTASNLDGKLGAVKYSNGIWGSGEIIGTIPSFTDGTAINYITPVSNPTLLYAELWKNSPPVYHKVNAYMDNGTAGWSDPVNLVNRSYSSNVPGSLTQPGTDFVADVIGPLGDNGWSHALKQGYGSNFNIIFQSNPGDYPVTSKTIKDAMGASHTSTFLYENGVYDADLNFAKYNKVTVTPAPGNIGKTVTYFYNDLGASDTEVFVNVTNYQELDGIPYKVKVYNNVNNTTPVKEETNTWSVYIVDATQSIYQRRLNATATTTDGITTTVSYEYNNSNGLVSKVTEQGNNGDRVTETAYAFQQSAYNGANGMDDKNMLSQVYSTTVSHFSGTPTYFAKNWTTWLQSNGYWHPDKTYVWNGTGTPPADPTSGTDIETSVLTYDAFGNVTQARNANKVFGATLWAHNNSLPIAAVQRIGGNPFFFDNFERDGLTNTGVTPHRSDTSTPTSTLFDGKFWQIGAAVKYHRLSNNRFISQNAAIEFDIRLAQSDVNHYVLLRDLVASADGPALEWSADGRVKWNSPAQDFAQLPAYVANQWYHVRIHIAIANNTYSVRIDDIKLTPLSGPMAFNNAFDGLSEIRYWTGTGGTMDIDNVRVYFRDGLMTSTTYDPANFLVTQAQDENGLRTYTSYDDFFRPMRVDDNYGQPLSESGIYLSRSGDANDTFNPALPNATLQLEFFDQFGHDTFINDANWNQLAPALPVTFGVLEDGDVAVKIFGGANSGIKSKTVMSPEDGFARVDFKMPGGSSIPQVLVLQDNVGTPTHRFSIRYDAPNSKFKVYHSHPQIFYGAFKLNAPVNQWYTALTHKYTTGNQTRCRAWVYPRGKGIDLSDSLSLGNYPANWQPSVRSWINVANEHYFLANFYRGKAVSTIAYSDGLGRSIQTQAHLGDKVSVSGTEYNAAGAAAKTYTFKYPKNNTWSFFDWVPLQPPPSTDSSIYVQETEYDDTPLQRVKRVYPGQLIGKPNYRNRYQEYVYDANGASDVPTYSANSLFRTKVTDEAGTVTYSYTDRLGNQVAAWTLLAGSNNDLFARFFYDILGRQTESRSPAYHTGEFPNAADASPTFNKATFTYNSLGRLTAQKLVDEDGNQNFKYDKAGNLRFTQNSKQFNWGEFTYYRYTPFNRLSEEGVCINAARFTQLFADSTAWPATGDSVEVRWKTRRYYGANYFSGGALSFDSGRLSKEEVNTDTDNAPEIVSIYRYDEYGNVTAMQQTIDGLVRTVSYQYDLLGNPTVVTYPSGRVITYGLDALGRVVTVRRQN